MRRTWSIGVVALLACAVAFWIYRATIPEETRIRRLVEGMAEGFNGSSARRTVGGLSDEFFDDTHGVGKPEIHAFLLRIFLQEREPDTKEFRYRVELGDLEVQLAPDETSASVRVLAEFSRRKGDAWNSIWTTRIESDLRKEDGGWKIRRASYQTEKGRIPWR